MHGGDLVKREELLAEARKHLWAAWAVSAEEIGSQAAETLANLGMLVPEGGAQELEQLREQCESYRLQLNELSGEHERLLAERHETNESLSDAAEALRANRDETAELERERTEAVGVSETLSRALHDEMLAGSALYAALTMPTTPEQRQAALDQFTAVAQRIGQLHGPSETDGITRRIAPVHAFREGEPAEDVTPQVTKLRALLAGQRAAVEDPHDSPLYHRYRVGHDLPETGGAR